MPNCPHCGRRYATDGGMFEHVLTKHREEVLSLWEDRHGVEPPISGQQPIGSRA